MTRNRYLAIGAIALLAACSQATPEQQVVNDAAEALGGEERIMAVQTLVMEGEGTQYNLGQDLVPDASGQTFTVTGYRRAIDVANGRARTELTRQPNFTFFQGPAAQRQVAGIDGEVAYNVNAQGNANRAPEAAAADRRAEYLHHPLTAVRAALEPDATLSNARTEGSESLVDVTTADGRMFTLAIDTANRLPSRVITRSYHTNLGDVNIETRFADYQDVNGLQLPATLTTATDDFTTAEIRLSNQMLDGDTGDLAAPEAAAAAQPAAGPAPVTVSEEQIAPGLWYLAGGSHHSVLVEFSDHLMLIEAPQNEQRTLAVIAKARELVPDKPLTQLVNSHHHFDHSGGVRAAISEGLTVITHEDNVEFFREIASRPHTIQQDALARNPREAMVEGVSDMREISDGMMTVQLYAVEGPHSESMLMAYFPGQRVLVEGDVYTPGSNAQSFSAAFLEEVRRRNLQVDRVVPLHGQIVPFAQFVKEASSAPATN